MPAEGNQVCISFLYDFLSCSGFKAPGCDDCPFEDFSEPRRRNRILSLRDDYVSSYPRLDDVQIGQTEPIQFLRDIVEQRLWITIGHAIPSAARRDADSHAVTAPYRNHCFNHFKQESRPILERTAITIGAPVDAILQKLISQVAVTRVKLNALKSLRLSALTD